MAKSHEPDSLALVELRRAQPAGPKNKAQNPNALSNNHIRAILEDAVVPNTLWIGTADGLNRFDRATEKIARFVNDPKNPHSLSDNRILAIYQDHTGALWIGAGSGGLNKFDPDFSSKKLMENRDSSLEKLHGKSGQITRFVNDSNDPFIFVVIAHARLGTQ